MNKSLFLFCFLAIASALAIGQNSPAEKFVRNFSEKKNTWLIEENYDSLKQLLDNRCFYIHSNGWKQSAAEVIEDLKSNKLVYKSIEVSELQARQFDHMVIVTGKSHVAGSVSEKDFDMNICFTEVYVNRKSGWKLVSRQSAKLN